MERISALMDGELGRDEVARLIPGVREREDLREAWETYHLIGDALRGQVGSPIAVARAVAAQLEQEPTVLAPRRASGNGVMRRFGLPSLAAAAAVAAVSWMSFETHTPPGAAAIAIPASHLIVPSAMPQQLNVLSEFAQASAPSSPAPQSPPIQLPSRQIDAYLAAHQAFSPSTTMQGLAPYVRTVTADSADVER